MFLISQVSKLPPSQALLSGRLPWSCAVCLWSVILYRWWLGEKSALVNQGTQPVPSICMVKWGQFDRGAPSHCAFLNSTYAVETGEGSHHWSVYNDLFIFEKEKLRCLVYFYNTNFIDNQLSWRNLLSTVLISGSQTLAPVSSPTTMFWYPEHLRVILKVWLSLETWL